MEVFVVFGFQPLVVFFTRNTKWRHLRLAEFLFSAGIFGAGVKLSSLDSDHSEFFSDCSRLLLVPGLLA